MTIYFPELTKEEVQNGLNKITSFESAVEKNNGIDWANSTKQYFDQLKPKYITWEFYERYTKLEPPFGQLGLPVFLRTYSRYTPFLNRREKWCETVLRVVTYSLSLDEITDEKELSQEAEELFDDLFNLRCLSAGRTMWVANTKIVEKDASANYNCSAATIDSFSTIAEGFYLLLVGSGFGFSVESKYVNKLYKTYKDKKINHKKYEGWIKDFDNSILKNDDNFYCYLDFKNIIELSDCDFVDFIRRHVNFKETNKFEIVVGDSKEGWVTALKTFLLLYTIEEVKEITFNYDHVRPEGSLLKTFGGRSSGHIALQTMFETIEKVINESTENEAFLKPIQVMDILNCIGLAVVVGGVRRSSQLVLADYTDNEIKNAKKDLWIDPELIEKRTTRVMSNNSLALYENPGLDWFKETMESVRTTGEPGFISVGNANKKDPTRTRKVFNPCFTGDTMVLTSQGHYPISKLVGKVVDVWDGKQWVTVDNFRVTGENQEVWEIKFHNGQSIKATPYHTFILEDGTKVKLRDLKVGETLKTSDVKIYGDIEVKGAYLKGFLIGDGTSIDDRPLLTLYEPKYNCESKLLESANELDVVNNRTNTVTTLQFCDCSNDRQTRKRMTGLVARNEDGELYDYVTSHRKTLPIDVLNWDYRSKCEFIAGLFDADGTLNDGKNGFSYQFTSVNESFLHGLQLLLLSIGVKSKIGNSRKKGISDFGEGGIYETQNTYRLSMTQLDSIKLSQQVSFSRLKSVSDRISKKPSRDKSFDIVSIKSVGVTEKVYCCTVPTNNSFTLSNTLLVGNCAEILLDSKQTCNLTEVFLPKHIVNNEPNYKSLEKSLRLATRMGSRITLVTMFHSEWDKVQKRDRLLGVSLSGIVDFFDAVGFDEQREELFYQWCNKIVQNEADKYHDKLGINRSLLKTTIKPSGTLSSLVGCGAGIHRLYAPYHYRRVRVSVNDPICKVLYDLGIPCKPENGQGEYRIETERKITVKKEFPKWLKKLPLKNKFILKIFGVESVDISYEPKYIKLNEPDLYGVDANGKTVNTWVFTFVVKNNTKIKAIDESAIVQLDRYKRAQNNYVDHNVSFTCSVDENEWDDVATWLYENYDSFIGVSFLPKFDSTNAPYPQLPYETIDKETYDSFSQSMPTLTENQMLELLTKYEKQEEEYELEAGCDVGFCPTR